MVLLRGGGRAEVASHLTKTIAVAADCQTVAAEGERWWGWRRYHLVIALAAVRRPFRSRIHA